jgi:hypothetical protein
LWIKKEWFESIRQDQNTKKDQFRNKSKLSFGEKQNDPDNAHVAQQNRATVYEAVGWRFESFHEHQNFSLDILLES